METQILGPLNELETSLNALVTSLTTTNTFSAAPAATRDILSADDALTSALNLLRKHQDNYARIQALHLEAERLQTQIKNIVRTCVDFRTEIGDIHPSLLDDDDESDDDDTNDGSRDTNSKVIDYDTLLAFAARIGKHNAAAAREAERDSTRRRVEAARKKAILPNGASSTTTSQTAVEPNSQKTNEETEIGITTQPEQSQNATQESQAELAAINDALAFQRASAGMAFPPPDRLRMGLLGQLQLLKEQSGEDAVENEIARLVWASENVAGTEEEEGEEEQTLTSDRAVGDTAADVGDRQPTTQRPITAPSVSRTTAPRPARVNLGFGDDESDDDD